MFALADGLFGLLIGRALIGLGVALALMAGFKAIVLWFPPERLALANGWLVMLGALGAVTATAPAELVVQSIGWRGLFAVLAGLSALAALLVLFAVPEHDRRAAHAQSTVRARVYGRSTGIAASGALRRSLPSASARPGHCRACGRHLGCATSMASIARTLCSTSAPWRSRSASARCFSARWQIGSARGHQDGSVLASMLVLSMAAQTALVLRWPMPSLVLCGR